MTVNSTVSSAIYMGDGFSVTFPVPFYFLDDSHLSVISVNTDSQATSTLVLNTDYSVAGAGVQSGGSITMLIAAPAANIKLLIFRNVPIDQQVDYTPNDKFPAEVTEQALDKITMILQEISTSQSSAIHYPLSEFGTDGTLPIAPQRASKVLAFDSVGGQTLVPLPASVGAGDLKNESWTDGVDFTAGTSNSVTLSRAYGTKANLGTVVMQGIAQDPNSYSLSVDGLTLQFNAIIPLGVPRIWCVGGTTLSLNEPATGSVTDEMIAPGSALSHRVSDIHSISDLDAVGDGGTDNSVSLQAMFTNAGNTGWNIPSGIFKFSTSLQSDYSAMTQPPGERSARGRIRGDSQSNTILRYSGAGYAAHFTGSTTGQGLDSFDTYSDFTLQDNAGAKSNSGIYVLNRGLFKFENVLLQYFQNGMTIDGSFTAELDNVHCRNSDNGLVFNGTNFEPPNLIKMISCTFGANAKTGVTGNINACINFDSCDISSNGTQGDLTTGGMVVNITTSLSGPVTLNGCYFENNAGASDVHIINNSGQPASVVVSGCTFNRGLNTAFTINNITVANVGAGSVTRVLVQGTSFVSVNSYVPSSSRVFLNGDASTEFIDGGGNSFTETVSLSNNPFTHGRTTAGSVAANGTATRVPPQITTSKIGTGVYQITHATGFAKDANSYFPSAISTDSVNGALARRVSLISATQFDVVMTDGAGNPVDAPFLFQVLQFG